MAETEEKVVRTTVWSAGAGCHGGCGVKLYIKDGKVVRVEGDEDHPWNQGRLCPRALALTQHMYHPDRILHPMKRVGKRGEGKWEQISWDEAYDTIEKRLKDIRDKYGAESVIFGQGTGRDAGGPITLLAYAYGSPNWTNYGLSGHSCYSPRQLGMFVTQGHYSVADTSQMLPGRYNDPDYVLPKVIINWAQNPVAADPDGFYGHWIIDCLKRGSRLITIDPRSPWIATRAEIHLQNRPGTDGAVALGMLNVIINEKLYDKEFVTKWCYGFDELKKRVQEYPPEKVAQITWVPKEKLIEAARLYATSKPAAIHWGVPICMNPQGSVVSQAISQLWAVTGNIDVPGGNVIARPAFGVNSIPNTPGQIRELFGKEIVEKLGDLKVGTKRYPAFKDFRGWCQPDVLLEQIESGHPYPIKAAWFMSTNPLACMAADPKRHYVALQKLDFIAFVDLFFTPTIQALGDIFLPASTFPEHDSFRSWWAPLTLTIKAIDIPEAKSDWEIHLDLAKRLSTTPVPYKDVKEFINSRLRPAGVTYDELVAKGGWMWPKDGPTRPYYRYEKGLLRDDGKPGFNTPTGKVELYSKWHEKWGVDPLPFYEEPPYSPVTTPELWKEYPFILSAGTRSPLFFHSEHRQIPWMREIDHYPWVQINPKVAKDLNITDGEWVYIENQKDRVKAVAKITPIVPPWIVATPHGWWLPETQGTAPYFYGIWDYNVNNLVPMGNQADTGFGGGTYRTCLCRIKKIEKQ